MNMRKPEQQLWDWLRQRIGGLGVADRVENRVGVGMPDVYIQLAPAEGLPITGWVELKVGRVIASDYRVLPSIVGSYEGSPESTVPYSTHRLVAEVRPAQVAWHERHAAAGGRSWFLVGVQNDSIWVLPGRVAGELADGTLRVNTLGEVGVGLGRKCGVAGVIAALRWV